MVKRPKSPDVPEDAKYLAVHNPYPPNASFELPGHYIAFAFWIASILGSPNPILGIHHKPKSRSLVILEVEKDIDFKKLLGEHRWEEVMRNPTEEEKQCVSKMFYCRYNTTRAAQKDGWKRIHVETSWFVDKGWKLEDSPFKHPYPETHWCPPLAEDVTTKNIARPLPVGEKPPPAKPALVPGSAAWVEAVEAGIPTTTPQRVKAKARGKGRGLDPRPQPQRYSLATKTHEEVTKNAPAARPNNPYFRMVGASTSALPHPNVPLSSWDHGPPPGLPVPPGLGGFADDDDSDSDNDGPTLSAVASGETVEEPVNLWADHASATPTEPEKPLCPEHGLMCKAGICATQQKIKREERRREEAEKREKEAKERAEAKKERKKNKKKGAWDTRVQE